MPGLWHELFALTVNGDISVRKRKQYPDSKIGKVSESIGNPFDDLDLIVSTLNRTVSISLVLKTMQNLFLVLT